MITHITHVILLTAYKYFELDLWSTFILNWISIYSNIADVLIYKYLPKLHHTYLVKENENRKKTEVLSSNIGDSVTRFALCLSVKVGMF